MRTLIVSIFFLTTFSLLAEQPSNPTFPEKSENSQQSEEERREERRLLWQTLSTMTYTRGAKAYLESAEKWLKNSHPVLDKHSNLPLNLMESTPNYANPDEVDRHLKLFNAFMETAEARSTSKEEFKELLGLRFGEQLNIHRYYAQVVRYEIEDMQELEDTLKAIPAEFKEARAEVQSQIDLKKASLEIRHEMYKKYRYALENGTLAGYGEKKGKKRKGKRRGKKKKNRKKPAVHTSDK